MRELQSRSGRLTSCRVYSDAQLSIRITYAFSVLSKCGRNSDTGYCCGSTIFSRDRRRLESVEMVGIKLLFLEAGSVFVGLEVVVVCERDFSYLAII